MIKTNILKNLLNTTYQTNCSSRKAETSKVEIHNSHFARHYKYNTAQYVDRQQRIN